MALFAHSLPQKLDEGRNDENGYGSVQKRLAEQLIECIAKRTVAREIHVLRSANDGTASLPTYPVARKSHA
jgi:hypothetical protein